MGSSAVKGKEPEKHVLSSNSQCSANVLLDYTLSAYIQKQIDMLEQPFSYIVAGIFTASLKTLMP